MACAVLQEEDRAAELRLTSLICNLLESFAMAAHAAYGVQHDVARILLVMPAADRVELASATT